MLRTPNVDEWILTQLAKVHESHQLKSEENEYVWRAACLDCGGYIQLVGKSGAGEYCGSLFSSCLPPSTFTPHFVTADWLLESQKEILNAFKIDASMLGSYPLTTHDTFSIEMAKVAEAEKNLVDYWQEKSRDLTDSIAWSVLAFTGKVGKVEGNLP